MTSVEEAVKTIRWAANQPEIDNGQWGVGGIQAPKAKLWFPKEIREGRIARRGPRKGKKGRSTASGGYKEWRYDLARAAEHLAAAVIGRGKNKNSPMSALFGTGRKHDWFMFKFYLKHNALESPDGKVGGTTLYAVWVEEAWQAAIWSPDVAKAVAELLEEYPESEKAQKVAELIEIQYDRIKDKDSEEGTDD